MEHYTNTEKNIPGCGIGSLKHQPFCIQHYDIIPGIQLFFYDILTENPDFSQLPAAFPPELISVQYCHKGRFEGKYANGEFFYLGEGDLTINLPEKAPAHHAFPLSYYQGANIVISAKTADEAVAALETITGPLHINFQNLRQRLEAGNELVIFRSTPWICRSFSELYTSYNNNEGILRLKIIELLIRLSLSDLNAVLEQPYFCRRHIQTVKDIHSFITKRLDEHFTVEELSRKFCIPSTTMKSCFKNVYGLPINTYLRQYRLKSASAMLCETSLPINEIALRTGYESPSKFAAAFKKMFGQPPKAYRDNFLSSQS